MGFLRDFAEIAKTLIFRTFGEAITNLLLKGVLRSKVGVLFFLSASSVFSIAWFSLQVAGLAKLLSTRLTSKCPVAPAVFAFCALLRACSNDRKVKVAV